MSPVSLPWHVILRTFKLPNCKVTLVSKSASNIFCCWSTLCQNLGEFKTQDNSNYNKTSQQTQNPMLSRLLIQCQYNIQKHVSQPSQHIFNSYLFPCLFSGGTLVTSFIPIITQINFSESQKRVTSSRYRPRDAVSDPSQRSWEARAPRCFVLKLKKGTWTCTWLVLEKLQRVLD